MCLLQLLQPISPGLVMAHALALGERATSAILAYSTDDAANSAAKHIHGKYVQHEGVVFMKQPLSASRPGFFTVHTSQENVRSLHISNTQDLATANPSVVLQELINGFPLAPIAPHHQPTLRLLACDGPFSRSPSPASPTPSAQPGPATPTTPAARKARRRGGRRHKHRGAQQHDDQHDGSIEAPHQGAVNGGVPSKQGDDAYSGATQEDYENRVPNQEARLCMLGLPGEANHTTLHALFEQYGQLHGTQLINRRGGARIGFVTLHSREAAERAMQDLDGGQVLVRDTGMATALL